MERVTTQKSGLGDRPVVVGTAVIVEPGEGFGLLLAHYLERRGWTAIVAKDGRQAVHLVNSRRPDLLVLDLEGSGFDGLDLLDALSPLQNRPAILACTRCAGGSTEPTVLRVLGVDAIVPRPCRLDALATAAEEAVATRQGDGPRRRSA